MNLLPADILALCYLVASVTYILGLKMLSHPDTARRGNRIAAAGMAIAVVATIVMFTINGAHLANRGWILLALALGAIIGTQAARKVQMTQMPEMVSLFNGMGGACAALIGLIEIYHVGNGETTKVLAITVGLVIGTVSFSGSMVAWGKLNGRFGDKVFPMQQFLNIGMLAIILLLGAYIVLSPILNPGWLYIEMVLCLAYGILFVLPIGGADMPVVISLLNSFTGVAAACAGFLYNNTAMLTGGILVGSAGTILTILMCKAMNRSLTNVLIGAFSTPSANKTNKEGSEGQVKEVSLSDAAIMMSYAKKVMIVPGYGLAVAQAQHTCHELEKTLEEKGVEVKYAIHPVAGRMPGHMNVLLAEADVPYPKLLEMEEANAEFSTADVVMILGANDVVNPAAKNDKSSPIFGMPILEVENAKTVIVNKRSMKAGYAGISNDLFYQPKTSMLFGDAKAVLQQLISEIKAN
ncbi:MAG TPA: NAD(P)(+) transhydrogenase (Re/Si-specific) subunit beta [Chitinophagales bacterium]|nr:NAD(P)(+) transhydrogenase (Re/Si-specific) subunit beta [Chitinophagales bacterium]